LGHLPLDRQPVLSKLAHAPNLTFDVNSSTYSCNIWATVCAITVEETIEDMNKSSSDNDTDSIRITVSFLLYSKCVSFIREHIDSIFDPRHLNPFLRQDIVMIIVESIGSLFLSQL